MAEVFSFFDPVLTENGVPDREYNAQEFTDYFGDLVTTGVMKGKEAELNVTANGSNMIVEIDTGVAFVEDKRYANTAKLSHTLDTETLGKDRIDRIVIRKDLNTDARYVKSFIKKGVASTSPVPPALTRNATVYEISLAQVKVIGGQTYISVNNVTDERGKDDVCPWAGSKILPNFDDAALEELVSDVSKKADKQQEDWIPLVAAVGWSASNMSGRIPRVRKDEFGVVHVYGQFSGVSGSAIVATLPVGYRHNYGIEIPLFSIKEGSNGQFAIAHVTVDKDGVIYCWNQEKHLYLDFSFSVD